MAKSESDYHITRCLELIEANLGWGKSAEWNNYDFSKLSDEVHKRTQVRLSVTTLKRIWGKLKYESDPTLTTLNALARFAGYADWRVFCTEHAAPAQAMATAAPAKPVAETARKLNRFWFLMAIPILVLAYFLTLSKSKPRVDASKFEFRADKMVTEGVPNSVVFHYNAAAASSDSVFIVQTWDVSRKKLVSRDNKEHSAIYYYPGFFNTKLIVDGEIVKRHDLWITSGGWLCLAEQDPVPLYFKKEETVFDDRVEIDESVLQKYNLPLHPKPPKIRVFNQRDLGDIMSDNFNFETSVKNDFRDGTGACQLVQVLIQCKDDIIIIPLTAKTCVGDMELYFCGERVTSETADLSGFGSDLSQWTTLRVETVNKEATFFMNGKKVYSLTFPNEPKGVVGVQFRFNGVGAVGKTWFEYGGKTVKL